ncbi:MAG: hypothetical protein ACRYFZ_26875 [Janthinobacterium lividum]
MKTKGFDPFPFPAATPDQQAHIRELAEALDAHRKRQQAQHLGLTLTDLTTWWRSCAPARPSRPKSKLPMSTA